MTLFKGLLLVTVLVTPLLAAPYLYERYQAHQNFNMPAATPPTAYELEAVAKSKKKSPSHKPSYAPEGDINNVEPSDTAQNTFTPATNTLGQDILGINTADVREDTSSVQFLNLFKAAIPFDETIPWGSSKGVEFDKNGWPTKLNGGKAGTKFLNRLPEGTVEDGFFTVLYDGEGEIFYGNDARLVVHRPNKDIIEIKAGKDHILNASLFIKKTNPDNYIRNIRILPEGGICEGAPHIRVKTADACDKKTFLSFEENEDKLLFNPDYLDFMKDFQVIRFMNMSGMTRNPVEKWEDRNTLEKATWGGKYGSRGAPVEVMVALANQVNANAWFSMPYKASDDYIKKFAEYVKQHLNPNLKAYIEYSNEVWNPIFIHHDYAIEQGLKAGLDKRKSPAGYKWYSRRSVQVFKIWEDVFGGNEKLVRVLGSWASNQNMSSQILAFEDAYKHTDAIAIGPYVSAHPKVLRKAKTVDDVFKAMLDKNSKWGLPSIINYIQKQSKVAKSFGVDLVAYEGGQHLVDWNTRKKDEFPNPLLYAANRDPRMGIIYDELLREWRRAGGKLFVAFSAPRIYSWYGSWGIKEHIRQPRSEAPKYDALLRYLETTMHPERATVQKSVLPEKTQPISVLYAKSPQQIWQMKQPQTLLSNAVDTNPSDISAHWQANWDSKHLYLSFAVTDESIIKGDKLVLTLDSNQQADQNQDNTELATQDSKEVEGKKKSKKSAAPTLTAKEKDQSSSTDSSKTDKETVTDSKKPAEKNRTDQSTAAKPTKKDDKVTQSLPETKVESIQHAKETPPDSIKLQDTQATTESKNKQTDTASPKTTQEKVTTKTTTSTHQDDNKSAEKTSDNELAAGKTNKTETENEVDVQQESTPDLPGIKVITVTPFDEPDKFKQIITTDTGYLFNIAIPWDEIKTGPNKSAQAGETVGINIQITDVDDGEKGSQNIYLMDQNKPLPRLKLNYRTGK